MVRRYPLSSQPFIENNKQAVGPVRQPSEYCGGSQFQNKVRSSFRWVGATRFASCDARPAGSSRFWLLKSLSAVTLGVDHSPNGDWGTKKKRYTPNAKFSFDQMKSPDDRSSAKVAYVLFHWIEERQSSLLPSTKKLSPEAPLGRTDIWRCRFPRDQQLPSLCT